MIEASGALPGYDADAELMKQNTEKLQRPLAALERALKGREFIAGRRFTIGDLNAVSIVSWLPMLGFDFANFPSVEAWVEHCMKRPNFPKRG
jgi:glutathione S-transferase